MTTKIESTLGEAHVRGIAISANTFLTNQVISCKEDDVVGNPMVDVQCLVRVRATSHITLLPFKRFQITHCDNFFLISLINLPVEAILGSK